MSAVIAAARAASRGTAAVHSPRYAAGLMELRLVDQSRNIRPRSGRVEPRTLVTYIRFPATGSPSGNDLPKAQPARIGAPYPLIVFGHGFRVTPAVYGSLLRFWTSAGYVVAAPVFPFENANAPGGPDERDIVNQPADMSFVVTRLLSASDLKAGPLSGMIDPSRIAVAGHSDGAETALAVAYARGYRDPRIRAAIILSGAKISGVKLDLSKPGPALLATQGSADTLNRPSDTQAFFDVIPKPKFLLTLPGAKHLAPYTYEQPQLRIIEHVTVAFLDHVFRRQPLQPMLAAADVPGVSSLTAHP